MKTTDTPEKAYQFEYLIFFFNKIIFFIVKIRFLLCIAESMYIGTSEIGLLYIIEAQIS